MKILIIILTYFIFTGTAYADLNEGLIAHYPFDGDVEDISGNENHGAVKGTTLQEALTEDRFWNPNSAFSFDGDDDYIRVPLSDTLNIITNKLSISVWVNLEEPLGFGYPQHYIFDSRDGEGGYSLNVDVDTIHFWIGPNDPYFLINIQSKDWHNLIVTYDMEFVSLYIDGELNSRNFFTKEFIPTTGPFWIGQRFNFIERFWGIMDDLRIYDRILSEEEILELYTGKEPVEPVIPSIIVNPPANIRINESGCFMETIK